MRLEHEELSQAIIGAAIAVHKELGPGFLEVVYENALGLELEVRGLQLKRQLLVPVLYRNVEVGMHRLDLVVDERMVVELKAIKSLDTVHFAVARSSERHRLGPWPAPQLCQAHPRNQARRPPDSRSNSWVLGFLRSASYNAEAEFEDAP
jgi:GxxExxY protein